MFPGSHSDSAQAVQLAARPPRGRGLAGQAQVGHLDQKKNGEALMGTPQKGIAKWYSELSFMALMGLLTSWERFSGTYLLGGAATCSEGFINCFLRVPQAVWLYCSCHAVQASRGNF